MTSYAYQNRASLPGEVCKVDSAQPSKSDFDAKDAGKAPERPSNMVANDRPQPSPRPSPGIAQEVDRNAFNERWADEQREARKAAFIRERTVQVETVREHTRKQTFNRSSEFNR